MQLSLESKLFSLHINLSIITRLLSFQLQLICTQLPLTHWTVQSLQLHLIFLGFLPLYNHFIILPFITGLNHHIFHIRKIHPPKNLLLIILFLEQLFVPFSSTLCRCSSALSLYCRIVMTSVEWSDHAYWGAWSLCFLIGQASFVGLLVWYTTLMFLKMIMILFVFTWG